MKSFKNFIIEKCSCDEVDEDADNTLLTKNKVSINPDGKNNLFKRHEKHIRPSIRTV